MNAIEGGLAGQVGIQSVSVALLYVAPLFPCVAVRLPTRSDSCFVYAGVARSAEKATITYDPSIWTPEKLASEIEVCSCRQIVLSSQSNS